MPIIYKIIAGVAVILAVFYAGQWKGHSDGKIEQLKDSVEAIQKRDGIDKDIANSNDYAVCLALGELRDKCQQLRRMDSTAPAQ